MSAANLSRRAFLRGTAMAGGGLVVGFLLPGCSEPGLPSRASTVTGSRTRFCNSRPTAWSVSSARDRRWGRG